MVSQFNAVDPAIVGQIRKIATSDLPDETKIAVIRIMLDEPPKAPKTVVPKTDLQRYVEGL